jgi:phosphate-selective porin OprO/OprP
MKQVRTTGIVLALSLLAGVPAAARQPAGSGAPQAPAPASSSPSIDDTIDAGEDEAEPPARPLVTWNEFEGRLFTITIGGGFLYDYAAYAQDADSQAQFELSPDTKIRDTRVLLKGRVKFLKRRTTWSAGIMYDYANSEWVFRQTGIMVAVPELWGDIFVGRSKEGFSLNKVMIGYGGWSMERATINDATIPILADGIKWLGYAPKAHLLWNVGVYGDQLSEGQTFSTYDHQAVARIAWLPILPESGETVLHLGLSLRYGKPDEGTLRLRSRPEAFPAPYFVDTGEFAASATTTTGLEIYYRPGSWTFGTEYVVQQVDAPESGNPVFHGGEAVATFLFTGETRGYNTRGGYFNQISPHRTVFQGGPGAWEAVGRVSYIDLDSGTLTGGRFWRLTPMLNWYLSDNVRLELAYGYGVLDRFGRTGITQFFQSRLQLQL